jgi:hypothetical protein
LWFKDSLDKYSPDPISKTPSQKRAGLKDKVVGPFLKPHYPKKKKKKKNPQNRASELVQVVEHLPKKCEALCSSLGTAKKKKEQIVKIVTK